eukprot:scaffold172956_cov31-Tisochrysis_lutea.AAC.1
MDGRLPSVNHNPNLLCSSWLRWSAPPRPPPGLTAEGGPCALQAAPEAASYTWHLATRVEYSCMDFGFWGNGTVGHGGGN